MRRFVATIAVVTAFWPVLIWWGERALDSSDEPWGILAGLLLLGTLYFERRKEFSLPVLPLLAVVVCYTVSFPFVPNLVRGLFAATALGMWASHQRGTGAFHFGTWGLAAMTLPWLASLQFFLNYPLRWVTSELSVRLLSLSGLPIVLDGFAINWGPISVWVDAPCSGVRMLWVGVFLAAALSFVLRLRNVATISLFMLSLVATILGNVARASAVFYLESGLIDAPEFIHPLTGVVAFVVISVLMVAAATALRKFTVPSLSSNDGNRFVSSLLVLASIFAVAIPFATPDSHGSSSIEFPGFPATFESEKITPREISEREKPYLKGFPGEVAAFASPSGEILMRWVHSPTRKLHSAADCYRGLGYEVVPVSQHDGWARYSVTKDGVEFVFEEKIIDAEGATFTDVGAWYWAATLGKSHGPWWNVVRKPTRR